MKNEMLQAAIFILKEITAEIPIFTNYPLNEKDILKPKASKTSNKGEDITRKFSNQKKELNHQ
ncbi:MAG: hypothetical protein ISP24_05050 [Rickettsiales bacterium]|nr:hypothetical protein [Rickettsiales bacterium]